MDTTNRTSAIVVVRHCPNDYFGSSPLSHLRQKSHRFFIFHMSAIRESDRTRIDHES